MKPFIKIKAIIFLLWVFMFAFSFFTNSLKQANLPEWNIIFVLDVSNSMNVEDVFYNWHSVSRLELWKKIIENNVDKVKKQFWLIVFSDKFDYFIPPTLDVKTYKTYLKTINTNILDGWHSNFVKSFTNMQEILNPSDVLIVISDFDTNENLKKISLKNYTYAIWVWTNYNWVVKDKDWRTLYKNWEILTSSLNKNKLKEFWASEYKIISSYKNWEVLDFLKNFKNKNVLEKKSQIDYLKILWFAFIIISL